MNIIERIKAFFGFPPRVAAKPVPKYDINKPKETRRISRPTAPTSTSVMSRVPPLAPRPVIPVLEGKTMGPRPILCRQCNFSVNTLKFCFDKNCPHKKHEDDDVAFPAETNVFPFKPTGLFDEPFNPLTTVLGAAILNQDSAPPPAPAPYDPPASPPPAPEPPAPAPAVWEAPAVWDSPSPAPSYDPPAAPAPSWDNS